MILLLKPEAHVPPTDIATIAETDTHYNTHHHIDYGELAKDGLMKCRRAKLRV